MRGEADEEGSVQAEALIGNDLPPMMILTMKQEAGEEEEQRPSWGSKEGEEGRRQVRPATSN